MLFAPHQYRWALDIWGDQWGSYWWYNYPIFANTRDVVWREFYARTAFVALLIAVIVNLRKSWRRTPKPPERVVK